jgi:hypothetical protein
MKTINWIIALSLLVSVSVLTQSCNDDDDGYSLDKYVVELGTIVGVPGDYMIVTDAGKRLFPSANDDKYFSISNKRVWVNYTILGEGNRQGVDYFVKVNDFTNVLTKNIIKLTTTNADSIGNDGLIINDIWISNQYLNVRFTYEGSPYTTHYINLVKDANNPTLPNGTPVFEIRHNKNGDTYKTPLLRGFASFELRSLETGESGSLAFKIKSKGITTTFDFDGLYAIEW